MVLLNSAVVLQQTNAVRCVESANIRMPHLCITDTAPKNDAVMLIRQLVDHAWCMNAWFEVGIAAPVGCFQLATRCKMCEPK